MAYFPRAKAGTMSVVIIAKAKLCGVSMFRLVMVLGLGLFLTLLIGGEDKGQMRLGLVAANEPASPPALQQVNVPQPPDTALTIVSLVAEQPSAPVVTEKVVLVPVTTAAPVIAPEFTPTLDSSDKLPVMYVSSRAVNVRGGPSTAFEVVDRLTRAEAVTVVSPEQNGWVQIRIEGDGIEGYVAARLLTDTDPLGN
jgi:uncharacterized protein YgiM (DUF1202 family)